MKNVSKSESICRLCLSPAALQDSHIIPEFFWAIVADWVPTGKHGIKQPSLSTLATNPKQPEFDKKQRGKWDSHMAKEKLLCAKCEKKIGAYETAARLVLFGNLPPDKVSKGRLGIIDPSFGAQGAQNGAIEIRLALVRDYRSFKKFELSLLWRASISSRKFYELVKLEAEDEESIRSCLNSDDVPPSDFFGCQLLDLYHPDIDLTKCIDTPRSTQNSVRHAVVLILAGYAWSFYIRPKILPQTVVRWFLQENGTLPIQRVDGTPMLAWWNKYRKGPRA